MYNMLTMQGEAYSRKTFRCGNCKANFEATIITWVDVSKTPQAKQALLKWAFNLLPCTHCGCRNFSDSPFFYEDFEEGLLVAVFPGIPNKREEVEKSIRTKYGYYPVLEFFYDMTQIWMLIYFQEHYRVNRNLRALSRIGQGEERLRKMLRFLKEDPLMITIREKLTESLFNDSSNDDLVEVLAQAVYTLEEMLPWPKDRRCLCGADLADAFTCCNKRVNLAEHELLLSRHYVIYCPVCKESLSGASCEQCGRVYTWKRGSVTTYKRDDGDSPPRTADHAERKPQAQL
jgi:hypothetical protein